MLFEHSVWLSRSPPALQVLAGLTPRPAGTTRALPGVNPTAAPFEAKAVCEASTETPNQTTLFQSWTNRTCGCRAQLKPTTYCASIDSGAFSVPGRIPSLFAVTMLQAWPARKWECQLSLS